MLPLAQGQGLPLHHVQALPKAEESPGGGHCPEGPTQPTPGTLLEGTETDTHK